MSGLGMSPAAERAPPQRQPFQEAAGAIEGIAAAYGPPEDGHRDIIAPGAFKASLHEHRSRCTSPLMLWSHKLDEPIGVWDELRETPQGLQVRGRLSLETARGREAHALLLAGAPLGLSIGYKSRLASSRAEGGRIIGDAELIEISIVSLPASRRSTITSVKSALSNAGLLEVGLACVGEVAMYESKAAEPVVPAGGPAEPDIAARVDAVEAGLAELTNMAAGLDKRVMAVESKLGAVKSSTDRIELKLGRPGIVTTSRDEASIERKAFAGFVRRGREALEQIEVKALRVSDDTSGGYLAPPEFVRELIRNLLEFSPIRQAARVGSTGSGEVILPKRIADSTASWTGETATRLSSQPAYGQTTVVVHELATFIDVSQRLLEDSAVNLEAELAADLAEAFGKAESAAFITGDGIAKPLGILADTAFTTIANGHATNLSADSLITAFYSLPASYRGRGTWLMAGTTLAAIRKLKESSQGYLWQPSLAVGSPETILGRPALEAVDLPAATSGLVPILFGDFGSAFRIYDRIGVSVLRDPYSMATSGLVRFHARRRVGGALVLAEAIKGLKMVVS